MTVRANTKRSEEARSAHVPATASHARADEWVHPDLAPLEWGPDETAVISAELVACTLGQRRHADRLELRTDLAGRVLRSIRSLKALVIP